MARRGWKNEPGRHSLAARGVKSKCHPSKSHQYTGPKLSKKDADIAYAATLVRLEADQIIRRNPKLTHEQATKEAIDNINTRLQLEEEIKLTEASLNAVRRYMSENPTCAMRCREEELERKLADMKENLTFYTIGRGEYPMKSDFLWYSDEDTKKMKEYATKERSFTSLGHETAQAAKMSQQEAFKILSEWGDVMNPADYDLPDAYSAIAPAPYKSVRDPKKWYTHAKHTGWRKSQSPSTRRAKLLAASPKNYTRTHRYRLAGRRAQALANVTQDKQTAMVANQDAAYFFDKLVELRT